MTLLCHESACNGDNEGNYYGVDFHPGAVAYYNMDIMNEAGIDPADIVAWDDYVEAGKTVLEKTGTPMCAVEHLTFSFHSV